MRRITNLASVPPWMKTIQNDTGTEAFQIMILCCCLRAWDKTFCRWIDGKVYPFHITNTVANHYSPRGLLTILMYDLSCKVRVGTWNDSPFFFSLFFYFYFFEGPLLGGGWGQKHFWAKFLISTWHFLESLCDKILFRCFLVSPHSEEKNMEVAIFKRLGYLEVPKHNRIVENVYFWSVAKISSCRWWLASGLGVGLKQFRMKLWGHL
jgi:hypothetical protein